jgi:hypothetical protein
MVTIDSYSEANYDANRLPRDHHPSDTSYESAIGQSFTCLPANYNIDSVSFYMMKTGSPTGTAYPRLAVHSGVYGTSSVPGAVLADGDGFDVSTLAGAYALVSLTFSGAERYEMVASTQYCIYWENPSSGTIDTSNYPRVGVDGSSPTHGGNYFSYGNGSWGASSTRDCCFYVYGTAVAGGISIPVAMHHYSHHISKIIRG